MDDSRAAHPSSIALIASHLYPRFGLETAVQNLARFLTCEYPTVKIICISQDAGLLRENVRTIRDLNVEVWAGPNRGFRRAFSAFRLRRRIRAIDSDVVIACGAWAAIPLLLSIRNSNARRTIVWEHSFDQEKVRTNKSLRVLRALAKALYRRASTIACVSRKLELDMETTGFITRKVTIANLIEVDDDAVNKISHTEAIAGRLICVGTLSATKNQALAIRTLSLLPEYYTLDVVGDGPERSALERLAEESGVADRVTFHGYVNDPVLLMRKATILVHPAHGETFGIVLFEASSVGVPVVALNQSVMADIVPELIPGALAEPTVESFAEAITQLTKHPPTAEDFARANMRRQELVAEAKARWIREINIAYSQGIRR
ncbi:glycosyltransferase [Mycolicibacterium phlei]|nr:glycosyltransferase [Mycolicibacterium phlei]